jgi:hypothetical protein
MMTLMLSQKEPMKKDSWGWLRDFLKCWGYRIARASMQAQRRRKAATSKMKTIRPMV